LDVKFSEHQHTKQTVEITPVRITNMAILSRDGIQRVPSGPQKKTPMKIHKKKVGEELKLYNKYAYD